MRTAILIGFLALTGCGPGEQIEIAFYGEGTGEGDIRVENDEEQVIVGSMDATSTAEGGLAAGSQVTIRATGRVGSVFSGFGGDCAGASSPFTFELTRPMRCSVKFDAL
jgi:hypothetical protein